jgi:hypothetical protein
VGAYPAALTVARVSTATVVAESIRRCSSLPLRVPTVPPAGRRGFLESRGKYWCWGLWDARHRLSKDCARRGDSDRTQGVWAWRVGVGVGV